MPRTSAKNNDTREMAKRRGGANAGIGKRTRSQTHQGSFRRLLSITRLVVGAEDSRLDQLARDIAGDFQRLRYRAALRDQALKIVGRREIDTFRQLFDVNVQGQFHLERQNPFGFLRDRIHLRENFGF